MKAITATVSFTIKNRFYKEDLDEQLESYKEEIEALLDYDCDVYNPIKEEAKTPATTEEKVEK